MIKRLLPYHHLAGLKHDWVIEFIRKHSSKYRFYIKTDSIATVLYEEAKKAFVGKRK